MRWPIAKTHWQTPQRGTLSCARSSLLGLMVRVTLLTALPLAYALHLGGPTVVPRAAGCVTMLTEQEQRVSAAMEIAPVAANSARSWGLAKALDDGTRKSHSMAENTQFVTGFFRGIATRDSFAQLVASLYFVYEAMEHSFDATADASVAALDYPELRRLASLEADMTYYYGDDWRDHVRPTPATREYVSRIEHIAREQPTLLVAHQCA